MRTSKTIEFQGVNWHLSFDRFSSMHPSSHFRALLRISNHNASVAFMIAKKGTTQLIYLNKRGQRIVRYIPIKDVKSEAMLFLMTSHES